VRFPISAGKILRILNEVRQEGSRPFRILLVGGDGVGKASLGAWFLIGNSELSQQSLDSIAIWDLDRRDSVLNAIDKAGDASLILFVLDASAKNHHSQVSILERLKEKNRPILIVLNKRDLVGEIGDLKKETVELFQVPSGHVVLTSATSGTGVQDELIPKIAALSDGFDLALANKLPIFSSPVANRVVRRCAYQNAFIGGMTFLPGADMPILTLNQMRMLSKIAYIYGEEVGLERLKELLVVLGCGVTFRALARSLVSLLPGFSWGVKAGVAYGGTLALGKAAIKYFQKSEHRWSLDGIIRKCFEES